MVGEWKSKRIEKILFSLIFCLVGSEKMEGWKKVNLYKFTHTPLLKNDGQLKQKTNKQKKKNQPIY